MSKICTIFHECDLDGWMSAAIVKHWFETDKTEVQPNMFLHRKDVDTIDFIGYNYGQPIPDLSEYDKVIMCDISFPMEKMYNLVSRIGNNLIWIDHHISAIKDFETWNQSYGSQYLEGLRDTRFAACELTWKYLTQGIKGNPEKENETDPMPEIVRLLGRYDCFGSKDTEEHTKVLEFQYGARQCISNYTEAYMYLCANIGDYEQCVTLGILEKGRSIYKYLCTEAEQTYKNGFAISLPNITIPEEEYVFICINKERFNPINFGIDYHKNGYDGAACFWYANGMWNFSIYNDNGLVDCSVIAKQYGGGGHFSASGFICNNETFLKIINNGRNLERHKRV